MQSPKMLGKTDFPPAPIHGNSPNYWSSQEFLKWESEDREEMKLFPFSLSHEVGQACRSEPVHQRSQATLPVAIPWDTDNKPHTSELREVPAHQCASQHIYHLSCLSHPVRLNMTLCEVGHTEREDLSLNAFGFVFSSVVPKPDYSSCSGSH